jgi:hypothetical protein
MEKNCENCNNWKGYTEYQPDYSALEQENAELTQALEWACQTIAEICHWNSCHYDCPVSKGCYFGTQEPECVERLVKHFKEAAQ